MTIQEILRKTYSTCKLSPLDAEILLSLALKKAKEYILAHPEKELTPSQTRKFNLFVERRSAGEPVAYIVGEKEFFGLDFLVNENVLIPRPETELLVERSAEKINKHFVETQNFASLRGDDKLTIIDVGTGSGNIIISIAKNIPKAIRSRMHFFAVDISKKSLQVAKTNAKKYKLDKKIKFVESDLLEYFLENKNKIKNIFIVANLPYVSQDIYNKNKSNLACEPEQALLSPEKGLAHYKKLLAQINSLSADHSSLLLEISPEQKPEIGRIMRKSLPKAEIRYLNDLAGKWRIIEIETIH